MKHIKLPVQITGEKEEGGIYLPRIGRRIVKTAIAVFLCLVIYALRGFEGDTMPTESAITAIICIQHDVRDTRTFAFNRFTGTLVGTVWGILLLLLLIAVPSLGQNQLILYSLMAVGVMMALYTTVVLRITDASNLAAIVFLCIVIAFPDIDSPFHSAALRVLDVFIGTVVAILVNVLRLPRRKDHSK
nr:FUSC family protein [Lachnospiraceae bacterium]